MLRIVPLGDTAALAYLPDENAASRLAAAARAGDLPGRLDVVQAYASVAIFFDPGQLDYDQVEGWLSGLDVSGPANSAIGRTYLIPCCYELGLDWDRVCEQTGLSRGDVIACHSGMEYTVYAIGFCPGFPYLGYLPPELCGVARLPTPRSRVEAGSVGMTGRQTGIYPLERPGGWNLIGRTPLQLVHLEDGYFPLSTGDRVRFRAIDRGEFERLKGIRLGQD